MARNVGDGTGTNAVPEDQGLTANQDAAPENPSAPFDSNRGGRGPEVQPASNTPAGED
jgi:hypothetical protein